MSLNRWAAVDRNLEETLKLSDPVLAAALQNNGANGLPAYDVSPPQGKFLQLVAKMIGARRILEIGALGGYSTIFFARALPEDGRLITLERDPAHAKVAGENIERAGLSKLVEIRVGAALDTLPQIAAEGLGPFDLIFIDADKPNNPAYWAWALKLARPGAVIIGDNVIRDGAVADAKSRDPGVVGVRAFLASVGAERRASSTALQTVDAKGWDGFTLSVVD
jgi:predicted O-methyltransferase YrrM